MAISEVRFPTTLLPLPCACYDYERNRRGHARGKMNYARPTARWPGDGRTFGVVGMGEIGRATARKARRGSASA